MPKQHFIVIGAGSRNHKILGAQIVGPEGVSKRLDVFATAITAGLTVREEENLDLGYAHPFAPVYDPVLIAAGELQKRAGAVTEILAL
jgi:hypothetical protein